MVDIDRTKLVGPQGHRRIGALFLESYFTSQGSLRENVIYTTKSEDVVDGDRTIYSLKRLYLLEEDLTEYEFANKYFHDWKHWEAMLEAPWFKEHINRWRTELELKLKAESLKSIIDEARIGGKNSYDAKKFLIAKGWIDKSAEPSRRGRPSKQEIARQAAELAFNSKQEDEAIQRLNLKEMN